jgi:hypothetical protein
VPEQNLEQIPKDIIRVETALSRFPIHRLSKKGNVSIEIKKTNPNGELRTRWEVTYNSKFGQPGPLAYKLDTLIINRRIEEAGKPVPKVIKLGSLSEIGEELGLAKTRDTGRIRKALRQNAGAFIAAKFSYKATNREERFAELEDTRYGIIYTGERLPNGEKADAVYLVLHDIFREILNNAPARPLDYDYMRELSPAAQRFYELLSYQIYTAIRRKTVGKLLYSELCLYAPQTRYEDWEHIKKQMYKLHKPHLESGYIEKVTFEETWREDGTRDWTMIYVPGARAWGEHTAALAGKHIPRARVIHPDPQQLSLDLPDHAPKHLPQPALSFSAEEESLITKLHSFGVSEKKARELVKTRREAVEAQIAAYPYREEGKPRKNAPGWLIAAIEGNYTLPVAYVEEQEKKQQAVKSKEQRSAVENCRLCDEKGWRRIRTPEYPDGAMKRCTHNPDVEGKYESAR